MNKEEFKNLLLEFNDLNDRTSKLRTLILDKDKFDKIDNLNKDLLIAQLKTMESYLSVLSIRIGLNNTKDNAESLKNESDHE